METIVHVAKVALAMTALSFLISVLGGWMLALIDRGPWDKDRIRDEERPIDFIGRRW